MNIIVKTASGHLIVRPDTTWEKDNEDLYVPDEVSSLSFTPVLAGRITKPGRSVGLKFTPRYFDCCTYGVLLYPDDLEDGSPEGFACASCLDHTSLIPGAMFPKEELPSAQFRLFRDNELIFGNAGETVAMVEKALEEATRRIYIRTGDLIAIELQPRMPLLKREDDRARIWAEPSVDFNIIF